MKRWIVVSTLAVAGCVVDLGELTDAQIACKTDADCPDGRVCREAIARCVGAGEDSTPPELTLVSITPNIASNGAAVDVVLTASEPTFGVPEVALELAGGTRRPFTLTDEIGVEYHFTFTPSRSVDTEGTWPILATATDLLGNTTTDFALGTVELDFTPPALAGPLVVLSPDPVAVSATSTVQFTGSEDLVVAPRVEAVMPGAMPAMVAGVLTASDPMTRQYTFDIANDPMAGNGFVSLRIDLEDRGGNATTVSVAEAYILDADAPVLVGTPVITLVPSAANPLALVSRAGEDTTVQVSFQVSELLPAPPMLVAAPPLLNIGFLRQQGAILSYEATVGAMPGDGEVLVTVSLTDSVGNQTLDIELGRFVVDGTEPLPPAVDTPDAIIYQREPFGSGASGYTPRLRLQGAAGAVQVDIVETAEAGFGAVPAARILVFASAGAQIGDADVMPGGDFTDLTLSTADQQEVWVAAVDRAGNVSPQVRVRDIEWTINPLGKVAGDVSDNPTRLLQATFASDDFYRDTGRELSGTAIAQAGDAVVLDTFGDPAWSGTARRPMNRYAHELVYDYVNEEIYQFGGQGRPTDCPTGVSGRCDDTWVRGNGNWSEHSTMTNPSERVGYGAAYDRTYGVMVLYGGCTGSPPCAGSQLSDTWEYNGVAWTQIDMGTDPARGGHTVVYDSNRERLISIGGRSAPFGSFVFNRATGNWDPLNDTGFEARWYHAAAYDEARDEVVLFGGFDATNRCDGVVTPCGDTWVMDAQSGVWTERVVAGPLPRTHAQMVYDSSRQVVWMFGGYGGLNSCDGSGMFRCNGVHSWDGVGWTTHDVNDLTTEGPPLVREQLGAAFDARRSEVVVAGGSTGSVVVGDEWTLDPAGDGRPVHRFEVPVRRAGPLGIESTVALINFQPGQAQAPNGYLVDDGTPTATRGGWRYGWEADIEVDARERDLLSDQRFDTFVYQRKNQIDHTWEIDLPNGTYSIELGYGDPSASGMTNLLWCMDIEGVLFKHQIPWTEKNKTGVLSRDVTITDGALTLETTNPFSGCAPYPSNQVQNGINFIHVRAQQTPLKRATVRWDAGATGTVYTPATEFDVLPNVYTGPTTTDSGATFVGQTTDRLWHLMVRYSSTSGTATVNQWCLIINMGAPICANPGTVLNPWGTTVSTIDRRAAPAAVITSLSVSVDISATTLNQVNAEMLATALGGGGVDGVSLNILESGGWRELGTNSTAADSGGRITYTTLDPLELMPALFGPQQSLRFGVFPVGDNGLGSQGAQLTSEWVEVQIDYRLP